MAITVTRGMINSMSDAVSSGSVPSALFIRDVPDFIPFLRRQDKPMLSLVPKKGSKNILKWEFGEGDLSPRQDTIAEDLDNSETALDVTHGSYFQVWDLVKVGSEVMLVTAINTNTLTVTRGWGSTSNGTATNGDPIYILGPAVPEGVDAPDSPVTRGIVNYTGPQILEYTWKLTNRAKVTPNYEIKTDQFKAELKRKMEEAAQDLNDLLLNGIYNAGDGTGTNPSTMGGLREATTTNVNNISSGPLELNDILTTLQTVNADVGDDMGRTLMGGYYVKRIINSWFQPSRRTSGSDAKMNLTWDSFDTDFGPIKFIPNYKCASNELFLCNESDWGLYNYEGGQWSTGMYATQGWYDKGFLRGDFGAIFQADRRRAIWTTFSTTDADYPNLDVAA